MKLLSAVAKPTRVATSDNPVVGDTIDIILNDANKLTFEGTDPKVALINTNLIPFIPGNGSFVVNLSNDNFLYGPVVGDTAVCIIGHGTYTRSEFVQAIAQAINIQGSSAAADNWGVGLDIVSQIEANNIKITTTKCTLSAPFFDDDEYWGYVELPGLVVGADSINNAAGIAAGFTQRVTGGRVPKCKFCFQGKLNGVPGPGAEFNLGISRNEDAGYILVYIGDDGNWKLLVGYANNPVIVIGPAYADGDTFKLTVRGLIVTLDVNDNEVAQISIDDPTYAEWDTGLQVVLQVPPQHQLSDVLMTTVPGLGTSSYGTMTQVATSYIDWTSEALEVMVGAGSTKITGTVDNPSVILCSTPPVANNTIGNILVCLSMECGGHLSGPKTQAVRRFIYTIPNATENLFPCTVIAPFLIPIDLDLRGYTSISRLSVQFVTQVDDQAVGFTAPASITLAFIE